MFSPASHVGKKTIRVSPNYGEEVTENRFIWDPQTAIFSSKGKPEIETRPYKD